MTKSYIYMTTTAKTLLSGEMKRCEFLSVRTKDKHQNGLNHLHVCGINTIILLLLSPNTLQRGESCFLPISWQSQMCVTEELCEKWSWTEEQVHR